MKKTKVSSTIVAGAIGAMVIATAIPFTASAQTKKAPTKPAATQPTTQPAGPIELAKFNDWGAYTTNTARGKVCYALSEPKTREPAGLKRDPGYLFVSIRPSEGVKNEVSFRFGFSPKEKSEAKISVGTSQYTFYTHNEGAWIRNATEELQLIESMKKGQAIVARVTSKRGNPTSDRYSLAGFNAALDRAQKECGSDR